MGAHYDSIDAGPGANDNGSGVAAALELAARFARTPGVANLRFVFFANEEAPFFENPGMGLARQPRERETARGRERPLALARDRGLLQ